jgi:hypothetical protein
MASIVVVVLLLVKCHGCTLISSTITSDDIVPLIHYKCSHPIPSSGYGCELYMLSPPSPRPLAALAAVLLRRCKDTAPTGMASR